ncbi:MAG: pyridoxal-phosphate dependent enzyme [Gemmataceae bacterium]|nr:pyridoxal-phosphate dependent enzyme [Gemmataceae bacterium]
MNLSLELICRAQHRLRGLVHRTPLIHSATLSAHLGAPTYLKLECLQKTGSFKPRGAFNRILEMSPAERKRGVVAVSGGNHAQGVAYAANQLGIAATICMPASTPRNYLDATRGYGAEIVLCPDIRAAFAETARLQQQGLVLVHPFDDPFVAAGQGTVGLEILEDLPGATRIYVSIGGGGFIGGVATAIRAIKPQARIIGVETHGADAMAQSLAAGKLVELAAITSIARTLGAPKVSDFTYRLVKELVEEVVVVDDASAARALFFLLERTKYLTEPAAACCLAAAEEQRAQFTAEDKVVIVLCGGNVSTQDLADFHARFALPPKA